MKSGDTVKGMKDGYLEKLGEGASLTTRNTRDADTGSTWTATKWTKVKKRVYLLKRGMSLLGRLLSNNIFWAETFIRNQCETSGPWSSLTSSASLSLSLSSMMVCPLNPLPCPLLWPLLWPLAWNSVLHNPKSNAISHGEKFAKLLTQPERNYIFSR